MSISDATRLQPAPTDGWTDAHVRPRTGYTIRESVTLAPGTRPRMADTDSFGKGRPSGTWSRDLYGAARLRVRTIAAQSPDACMCYEYYRPGRLLHLITVRVRFGRHESDDVVADSCSGQIRQDARNPSLQFTDCRPFIWSHKPGHSNLISVQTRAQHHLIEEAHLMQAP